MAFLLLLGLGALLLLTTSSKEPQMLKASKTTPAEAELIDTSSGFKVYRPDVRGLLVESLRTKTVGPNLDADTFIITETGNMLPTGESAYWTIKQLHAMGRSIWISPTLLNPDAVAGTTRWVHLTMAPTLGVSTPPPNLDVALLAPYNQPWPGLQDDIMLPSGAPPIPSAPPGVA